MADGSLNTLVFGSDILWRYPERSLWILVFLDLSFFRFALFGILIQHHGAISAVEHAKEQYVIFLSSIVTYWKNRTLRSFSILRSIPCSQSVFGPIQHPAPNLILQVLRKNSPRRNNLRLRNLIECDVKAVTNDPLLLKSSHPNLIQIHLPVAA